MLKVNEASLRLFNSIQIKTKSSKKQDDKIIKRTIKHGYILDHSIKATPEVLDSIEKIIGISGEKANSSFHKSWTIIENSSMEELVIQQIIHYISTYGFKEIGIFSEDTIYIPNEKLELPEITDKLPIVIIKGMTGDEILKQIIYLGSSGIALNKDTLNDIMIIVDSNKFENTFIKEIKNRELKSLLNDFYNIVPEEPIEFLRFLINKLTNESLVIKNDYLINKIKEANGKLLDQLIEMAPKDLASIFFRFKPLFLAMKSISNNKTFFNKLRKQANNLHKPALDYMNNVTSQIKNKIIDLNKLEKKLKEANIFRKIRLAYALKFRENKMNDSILYRIRNGRGWITNFKWPNDVKNRLDKSLKITISSIVEDIKKNVIGKTIYIPNNINYTLPATEKQFTGFLPNGSYVIVPDNIIVGIHWTNNEIDKSKNNGHYNNSVDLDLAVIGESGKIGWDRNYRSESRNVLFSGDMTNAPKPKGATELFYLKEGEQEPKLLTLNYYNFIKGDKCETKIFVAHEKIDNIEKNYMVNVNNIILAANINVTKKQNILGLIFSINNEIRFYFGNISVGNSISSSDNEQSTMIRKFLINNFVNSINFNDILTHAGANIISDKSINESDIDIDLSPEKLDKTSFLKLIL